MGLTPMLLKYPRAVLPSRMYPVTTQVLLSQFLSALFQIFVSFFTRYSPSNPVGCDPSFLFYLFSFFIKIIFRPHADTFQNT